MRADFGRLVSWHAAGGSNFFRRYSNEIIQSHKWCFIVGCNNSGTSLLQTLLEQTGHVSTFASEGQFYTRTLARAERRGKERVWTEYLADLEMQRSESLDRLPRLVHDWMREFDVPIKTIILEKTPANAVRMEWLQKAFPRSYFIGLVRNGYAVAEGIRRKGFKSLDRGARHWALVNEIMLQRANNVERFLEIRYEDLVNNYAESLDRLMGFIDISQSVNGKHNVSEITIREDHRVLKDFNAESIARLDEKDKQIIYRNAETMLRHFGYASD